jgi:hypothetical protein
MIQLHPHSQVAPVLRAALEELGVPYIETPAPAERPMTLLSDPDGPEGLWRSPSLDSTLVYIERKSGIPPEIARYRDVTWTSPLTDMNIGPRTATLHWSRLVTGTEEELGRQDYLAGDFSICDIANYASRRKDFRAELPADKFPNIHRWLARMAARPIIAKHLPD